MISAPQPNEDVRTLWRVVAQCVDVLNSLTNMTGVIEGQYRMTGRLSVGNGSSVFKFEEHKEVGDVGA